LAELIEWCEQTPPTFREKQIKVVFNLTGGFKSTNGWLQTLGMFYAGEIVYIFESQSEMLRIPRIPVAIDTAAVQIFRDHLAFFRRLAAWEHAIPAIVRRKFRNRSFST
jgi:CRISPR/Cas system-associated protein Csm6